MLSKTMQEALNDQIQKELQSSYIYLAMAAYCEANALPGSAAWMRAQSQEEHGHAMKLFGFVNDRNGRVTLQALAAPPAEWKSALDVFEKVLEHEQFISASIHKLYGQALKENDYPSQVLLQWFVNEQVEEEKNASVVVDQLKAIGESKSSLLMIDHHLAKRGA